MLDTNSLVSRRNLLRSSACGFGSLAFSGLLSQAQGNTPSIVHQNPLAPQEPMFPPRAKRIIFIFMQGGRATLIRLTISLYWRRKTAKSWNSRTREPLPKRANSAKKKSCSHSGSSGSTAKADTGSLTCFRKSGGRLMTSVSSTACTPTGSRMARVRYFYIPERRI